MKKAIVIAIFSMAVFAFGQTKTKTAKEILGKNFIEETEAAAIWGAITNHQLKNSNWPIKFSRDTLEKCARENKSGKADYYLVPILGLTSDGLLAFWHIGSNCLPLETTIAGWRLIDFLSGKSLCFSWSEEDSLASQRGTKILSAADYLEVIATISLLRNEEKTSNFSKFYFSSQGLENYRYPEISLKECAVVYSANVQEREALVMRFPKENFMPISVKPNEFSFITFGDKQNNALVFELRNGLRSFTGEIKYDVSVLDSK